MHPYLIEQLAEARRQELRKSASRAAAAAPGTRRPRRPTVRHRVGWLLVEMGLKLAGGPGGA